jgi:hypothetical protein
MYGNRHNTIFETRLFFLAPNVLVGSGSSDARLSGIGDQKNGWRELSGWSLLAVFQFVFYTTN